MSLTAPRQPVPRALQAGVQQIHPWPTVTQMLKVKRSSAYNLGRRFKTTAVMLQARLHRQALGAVFNDLPWAAELFKRHPVLFRAAFDQYLDVRHGMGKRFHLLAQDLRHMQERRAQGRLTTLAEHERTAIWVDAELGLQVDLEVNLHTPQEGLWRLNLHRIGDTRFIYALSFGMVGQRVMVGAMQGVKGDDGQDLVRQATKTLHGVRPHFFLIEVLRQLATNWRAVGVTGIDAAYQLKANQGSDDCHMVKFDYTAFWRELGGEQQANGLWAVPLQAPRKDLADVESKKRSMYRKRYAMLDQLASDISTQV